MKRILALIVVLSLLVPMVSVAESNDFSNSIALESGVLVSGYVTESDGDNPDDKYQILYLDASDFYGGYFFLNSLAKYASKFPNTP